MIFKNIKYHQQQYIIPSLDFFLIHLGYIEHVVVTLTEVIKLLAYNMVDSSLSFVDLNQFAVTATSFGKILLTYTFYTVLVKIKIPGN